MTSIYSQSVDRIGYDADAQELHVTWKGGKTSIYSGVPAGVADSVSRDWSVGRAVQTQIIPNYPHRYGA